ncbi:hypothetical protein AMTR_s00093p00110460 [Amborella trichopoda]|uniref:Uncharacterized protein n=1 Tax=Amborella trichopoda TaxID=13333 RepID=W1NPR8_AMBTC|nr:hypothetical protein AMTR_s00093p00110460 [Amborella trichopoda]
MSAPLKARKDRKGGRKRKGTKKSKSASPRLVGRICVSKKGLLAVDTSSMSPLMKRAWVGFHIASTPPAIDAISALVAELGTTAPLPGGSSLSSSSFGCESEGLPSEVEAEATPPINNCTVPSARSTVSTLTVSEVWRKETPSSRVPFSN